jgi:hypothetical protein
VPAAPDSPDRTPLITAQDPRTCIGEQDPENPNQLRAGLKLGYDIVSNKVTARLFLDRQDVHRVLCGQRHVGVGVLRCGVVRLGRRPGGFA